MILRPIRPRNFETSLGEPNETTTQEIECTVCGLNAEMTKRCTYCYDVQYCSDKCYNLDKPLHQPICQRYGALKDFSPRSNPIVMHFPHGKSFPEMLRLGVELYIKEGDFMAGVELSDFARHIVEYEMREQLIVRTDLKTGRDLQSEFVIRSRIPVQAPEPVGDIWLQKRVQRTDKSGSCWPCRSTWYNPRSVERQHTHSKAAKPAPGFFGASR